MTLDELVVKQQLEIEQLKLEVKEYEAACQEARSALNHPEQWSTKCPDFPKVAMTGIVRARHALESV